MYRTLLHHTHPTRAQAALIRRLIPGRFRAAGRHWRLCHEQPAAPSVIAELRANLPFDVNPLPAHFQSDRVKLIVSDMDSTLISIECIDELADRLGIKSEVASITEAAMRGELEFADALRRRVALLEGLPVDELTRVYSERLRFNPGAVIMVAAAKRRGIRTAVVSGGFTYFTDRVKADLCLDYALANTLEIRAGRLSGRLVGPLCGAETKAEFLQDLCRKLAIAPEQCIAIGDGANDLKMLSLAGVGIAYHAKPKVREQADAAIDRGGLDCIVDFFAEDA